MATLTNGEIFRKAADLIRTGGLWKGDYGPYVEGSKCIWTAIYDTAPPGKRRELGELAAERALGLDACGFSALYNWNDEPGRTAEHVITLLDGLAFDEDLKAAATADNPAHGVMATSNPVEQTHDSAIIPSLEAVHA